MGDKTKPELMEQQHEGINTQAAKEGPKQYYLKKPSETSWVIGTYDTYSLTLHPKRKLVTYKVSDINK